MLMYWAVSDTIKNSQVKEWANKIGFEIIAEQRRKNFIDYKLIQKTKNKVGQPKKDISKEEILLLRKKGNSMYAIAKMLGVSRKTLYNRLGMKKDK